jgi:cytochrome P450
MVINETLRFYPPLIRSVVDRFLSRVTSFDKQRFDRVASTNYQLDKYNIPQGSIISIPVYPIHHDANIWPDPERFIPERFVSLFYCLLCVHIDCET